MSNLYKERERGEEAGRIVRSPVWADAWAAYRQRIHEEIEAAPSQATDTVMHLKRLLTACTAAKLHLERIMKEGEVAAASIEFEERRKVTNIGALRPHA